MLEFSPQWMRTDVDTVILWKSLFPAGLPEKEYFVVAPVRKEVKTCRCLVIEGEADRVEVDIRAVVRKFLESDADGVMMSHNHPNGRRSASEDDLHIMRRMFGVFRSVGIDPTGFHIVTELDKGVYLASLVPESLAAHKLKCAALDILSYCELNFRANRKPDLEEIMNMIESVRYTKEKRT